MDIACMLCVLLYRYCLLGFINCRILMKYLEPQSTCVNAGSII